MYWISANLLVLMLAFATITQSWAQTAPPPVRGTAPPASAQPSQGTPTTEKPVTAPSQIDPGQLNILPSAGVSTQSAAPTMVFECGKNPVECTKPASPADKTTVPEPSEKPTVVPVVPPKP